MSDLLWQKDGTIVNPRIMRFLAGQDVLLDREFLAFDIQASIAHVEGSQRINVLSSDQATALIRELHALADDFAAGRFVLDAHYEDGHSAVESRMIERLGDVGR